MQECIRRAIEDAAISPKDIDAINGHLTSTGMCPTEINNWAESLDRKGEDFPYINSLKSMTGHCLAAAGSIESVASVLQIEQGFVFGNINNEDVHPDIQEIVSVSKIPSDTIEFPVNVLAKASFGFGDVNGCIFLYYLQRELHCPL